MDSLTGRGDVQLSLTGVLVKKKLDLCHLEELLLSWAMP